MITSYSKCRLLLFQLTLFIIIILVLEIGLRVIYFQRNSEYPLAVIAGYHHVNFFLQHRNRPFSIISLSEKEAHKDDPVLGYSHNPGIYPILIKQTSFFTEKDYKFKIIIGEDGYRITSENPDKYKGKPQIWIFGCSYTFGWTLDEKDTFAWLIQQKLPNYQVKNLGMGGHGNTVGLLQLKQQITNGNTSAVAIFVYNPFHCVRNLAAPSFINNELSVHMNRSFHYPKSFITEEGQLGIRLIPIKPINETEPSIKDMQAVTKLIFQEIQEICYKNNIIPVLAFQTGDNNDPIVQYCAKNGFKIIDISINADDSSLELLPGKYPMLPVKYQIFPPFDPHPNAEAHKIFAEKLFTGLLKFIHRQ